MDGKKHKLADNLKNDIEEAERELRLFHKTKQDIEKDVKSKRGFKISHFGYNGFSLKNICSEFFLVYAETVLNRELEDLKKQYQEL